ncbi:hypothetical protein ACFVUB_18000 [Streptomyces niveus]|uniref:hypothetical protein n=1 Tax=Streptomyces niveus TaxID=193462 RepID=UPI0036DEA12A
MADDRRPPHTPQTHETDGPKTNSDDAYNAAHKAFMAHVRDCYACLRRGIDCQDVGHLKARLRETQSAGIAGRTATRRRRTARRARLQT